MDALNLIFAPVAVVVLPFLSPLGAVVGGLLTLVAILAMVLGLRGRVARNGPVLAAVLLDVLSIAIIAVTLSVPEIVSEGWSSMSHVATTGVVFATAYLITPFWLVASLGLREGRALSPAARGAFLAASLATAAVALSGLHETASYLSGDRRVSGDYGWVGLGLAMTIPGLRIIAAVIGGALGKLAAWIVGSRGAAPGASAGLPGKTTTSAQDARA